jgi:CubicO group peptidase (beta-lactamase class C family)
VRSRRDGQVTSDLGAVDAEQVVAEGAWYHKVGDNFDRTAYGYQWWIIDAGPHTYYLAWGHGGQQIAVLPDLDMVMVVTADPLVGEHGGQPGHWRTPTSTSSPTSSPACPHRDTAGA